MDDPTELVYFSSPEEILKIEQSDYCVTLYTLWDKLKRRGQLGERLLYSCRNDSPVPDEKFATFACRVLGDTDVVVDRGEAMILSNLEPDALKDTLAVNLQSAMESL